MSYSSSSSESSEEEDWDESVVYDSRIVVHMDVDYFYCQCEEIEGQDRARPIAIGQKHIVVTCNYVARAMGVKKLQLKEEAIRACPSLLILDGSDLERYRRHSQTLLQCFRNQVQMLAQEYGVNKDCIAIRKGGMDEVYCDMTNLVAEAVSDKNLSMPMNAFIYGESSGSVVITEDQSGAQSILHHASVHSSSLNNTEMTHRLHIAAACVERIRCSVRSITGFTTSMGVSESPMLAKLASDLKKPNSLSILYPWRSSSLVSSMPLRKVPQLGHATLKALKPCLERYHNRQPEFWTCRDLTSVPRHEVLACLRTMNYGASEALCDALLQKCQGIDHSRIEDDHGGLSKTVSVENSFRRHTVRTKVAVWQAMDELFRRLPRLLADRRDCSEDASFPTTIRLTAAVVDRSIKKKRPFVVRCKQCSFDGKRLMMETDLAKKREQLRKAVTPLIEGLVFSCKEINVVRLNVAVTGFQDLLQLSVLSPPTSAWTAFTAKEPEDSASKRQRATLESSVGNASSNRIQAPEPISSSSCDRVFCSSLTVKTHLLKEKMPSSTRVDPAVLAELPPHIQAEVRRAYNKHTPSKRTIDQFFVKR